MAKINPIRDIAKLVSPPTPYQGMRFSQGTILAWNPITFENQVEWRGITLTDLPILGKIDGLSLKPGDVVGMMGWSPSGGLGSWWILGELAVPPLAHPVAIEGGAELLVIDEELNRWVALRYGLIDFGRITPEGTDTPLASIQAVNADLNVLANANLFVRAGNQLSLEAEAADVFVAVPNGWFVVDDGSAGPLGGSVFMDMADDFTVLTGDGAIIDSVGQILIQSGNNLFLSHTTTGNAPNAYIGGSSPGALQRSTSSRRYKTDIREYDPPRTILDLKPVVFRDRTEATVDPDTDHWIVGLIAEDVAELGLHEMVSYDEQGRPDAVDYRALSVALLSEVKSLRADVDALLAANEVETSPRPEPVPFPRYVPKAGETPTLQARKLQPERKARIQPDDDQDDEQSQRNAQDDAGDL